MGVFQEAARKSLHRSWSLFSVVCLLYLAGGYALLRGWQQPVDALRWLFFAGLVLAYLLTVLGRNLAANHRPGESELLPSLGWGNRISLLRGLFLAGLLGFLFSPHPQGALAWAPGLLYTLAILADFLDGYLARITNHTTRLGEILDISFDGVGVFGATALLIQYGKVPAWYLLVGLARYLFLAGAWQRRRLGKPVYDLPPNLSRRLLAGIQMGFLAALLWPAFTPPGTTIAATLFGAPFLFGFGRDWLIASGVIKPAKGIRSATQDRLERWLPLALRITLLALALPALIEGYRTFNSLETGGAALLLLESLAVILLLTGAAGRAAAILGLVLLGFHQMTSDLTGAEMMQIGIYTVILNMGSGALSLWRPEENLIRRRAGERPPNPSSTAAEQRT